MFLKLHRLFNVDCFHTVSADNKRDFYLI